MTKQRICFLQVSDQLLNPNDANNPADNYFRAIWPNMAGEGYYKPDHFWEIPTWIAELSYCLQDHELGLFHVDHISKSREYPILPDADRYFASVMDCNKEHIRIIVENNPNKLFYLGGYIGYENYLETFNEFPNSMWCSDIESVCDCLGISYQYGTDYSLFKGVKCIPRLTLSNGCINHCKFCTVPDEIIEMSQPKIQRQIDSMEDLNFELVYISDKTFGQAGNYRHLKYIYNSIKEFNPKFRGFIVQTTCYQILKFDDQGVNLKDLGIVNVEIGVESYNNVILKKYNKPQNTRTIDTALNILKNRGVNIIPNIIIGLPGENRFTYWATLDWLEENMQNFLMLNIFNFVSYKGSETEKRTNENLNEIVCPRSYHTKKEASTIRMFTESLFDIAMEILKTTKAKKVGMTDWIYDEPTCTEMPKYCNIWPCPGNEESKLELDENGFMWCIECGRCYGKK